MTNSQPRREDESPGGGQLASFRRPEPNLELAVSEPSVHLHPGAELIRARAVLLHGLRALGAQREAIVVMGAQAVYEHTKDLIEVGLTVTTDGDTGVLPHLVDPNFDIGQAMLSAGFSPASDPPGIWWIDVDGDRVAFDLLVPGALAGPGRRGARVPGQDKRHIGRADGLELCIVDRELHVLDPLDGTGEFVEAYIAGPAAIMCAKAYKLAERINEADRGAKNRVKAKDAGDVWRLMAVTDPRSVASVFAEGEADPALAAAVCQGRSYLRDLFSPGGVGVQLAVAGLGLDLGEERVERLIGSWMAGLRS